MNHNFRHLSALVFSLVTTPLSCEGAVAIDQIGVVSTYNTSVGSGPTPSQDFTDFPDFSCVVLEDFTVVSGQLEITNVSALFRAQGGFSSFQLVDGYAVNVFSDPPVIGTGLAGPVASLYLVAGSGMISVSQLAPGSDYGLVSLNVSAALPSAGKYWIGVSPVSASSVSGQFLLANSGASGGTPGDASARFANPGEGFGLGVLSILSADYAYSVTVVPEPTAAMIALLSGCLLCGRRRSPPRA